MYDSSFDTAIDASSQTKVCPRCHEVLFADMDICYGCLFDFTKQAERRPHAQHLDTLPSIDKVQDTQVSQEKNYRLHVSSRELDCHFDLIDQGIIIGRDPSCDIVLHSRAVSKQHVRISPSMGCLLIEDMGATNPAIIEGKEIRSCVGLSAGDVVNICGITLAVEERN